MMKPKPSILLLLTCLTISLLFATNAIPLSVTPTSISIDCEWNETNPYHYYLIATAYSTDKTPVQNVPIEFWFTLNNTPSGVWDQPDWKKATGSKSTEEGKVYYTVESEILAGANYQLKAVASEYDLESPILSFVVGEEPNVESNGTKYAPSLKYVLAIIVAVVGCVGFVMLRKQEKGEK